MSCMWYPGGSCWWCQPGQLMSWFLILYFFLDPSTLIFCPWTLICYPRTLIFILDPWTFVSAAFGSRAAAVDGVRLVSWLAPFTPVYKHSRQNWPSLSQMSFPCWQHGTLVNISNAAVRSQKSSHTNQTKSLANTNQIYHTNQTVATRSPCEHFSCSRRFLKSLHIQIKFSQLQSWKKSQDDKRSQISLHKIFIHSSYWVKH